MTMDELAGVGVSPKDRMVNDLLKSGLEPSDMNVRTLDTAERAASRAPMSVDGYVIPYFDILGKMRPFYRVRLFDHDPKYKQLKDAPNHVYFPKNFWTVAKTKKYVILTEGEKKAALLVKLGHPAVGLGGVDSWRNRIVLLPAEAELSNVKNKVAAKLSAGDEAQEDYSSSLAVGMQELFDHLLMTKSDLVICYDTDHIVGVKPSVQRAAATLGYELRFRGIAFQKIRQLILPMVPHLDKTAVDDYIMSEGPKAFQQELDKCLNKRSAFPRHPSVRDYINKRLQKPKMSRKETQNVAFAILSELDSSGMRLRSTEEGQLYYFDQVTRKLLKTSFLAGMTDEAHDSEFGQYLYREFGLSAADQRVMVWLSAQFAGEDPVDEVSPHRVIARTKTTDDVVHYQINDGEYVTISADLRGTDKLPGLELRDNGAEGILFESGHVKPLNSKVLLEEYRKRTQEPLTCWWDDVLGQVRLKDHDKARKITALLYYMSPWLNRWRGMQLPVELVLGESGSGKSTLMELRLTVLSGEPHLRNAPTDLKDWHASIVNSGGLHVTDNVQLVDRALRQRLSDELCRLVTEPNPFIEQRKYFTNSDLMRLPVRAVFAITAIQQPFQNADILQRSIITELDKAKSLEKGDLRYDSEWSKQQLYAHGPHGREAWISHHLHVLHLFFQRVQNRWDHRYQARHRLINFEQAIVTMAEVFGWDSSWIPDYLSNTTDKAVSEADWAFEGLASFCEQARRGMGTAKEQRFTAQQISEWAQSEEEYKNCESLANSRRLGRYLKTHKSMLATICGMYEAGVSNNRAIYKVVREIGQSK